MLSSVPSFDWRNPADERRPASVSARCEASPSTLTKTRARRRSGLVSTEVTVTNPMRGSFTSPVMCADRTSRTASFTRRIREPGILVEHLLGRDQGVLDPHTLRELRLHVALELRGRIPHAAGVAADQRRRHRGALPQVVVIGLGDGRAEAPLELRLQRGQLLALALEASVVREVEVDLQEADEAHVPPPRRAAYSSSRSTWRVS